MLMFDRTFDLNRDGVYSFFEFLTFVATIVGSVAMLVPVAVLRWHRSQNHFPPAIDAVG